MGGSWGRLGNALWGHRAITAVAAVVVALAALGSVLLLTSGSSVGITLVRVPGTPKAISCTAGGECTAVGTFDGGKMLVLTGRGRAYEAADVPNPEPTGNVLDAVDCSGSVCIAAGSTTHHGEQLAVLERRAGTWSVVKVRELAKTSFASGASCGSVSECVTVGVDLVSDDGATLGQPAGAMELGHGWEEGYLPGNENGAAYGVSCPTATTCFAVGTRNPVGGGNDTTYIAELHDGRWKAMSAPKEGSRSTVLTGVSCASATSCVAVGETGNELLLEPLLLTLSGTSWKQDSVPLGAGGLNGVSCADGACMAVGYTISEDAVALREVEGGPWKVVYQGPHGQLSAVSCYSATRCAAIGTFQPKSDPSKSTSEVVDLSVG